MAKRTLFSQIGKSNWYSRVNARGKTVKIQSTAKRAETRNNIIRGVWQWYYEVETLGIETARAKREQKRYMKTLLPADEERFYDERPEQEGTIILYDVKTGAVVEKRQTTPDNYFLIYRNMYYRNYDRIRRGELAFKFEPLPGSAFGQLELKLKPETEPKKRGYKSTLWRPIGKGYWYSRYNSEGRKVLLNGREKANRANKIIRGNREREKT